MGSSEWDWSAGCTSSMQSDSNTDYMCQVSYGGDNNQNLTYNSAYSANVSLVDKNYSTCTVNTDCASGETCTSGKCYFVAPLPVTDAYGSNNTLYANASKYGSSYPGGCSDSWLGDGTCDMCLIAKYGFDSATGPEGDDDCAIMPTTPANGTTACQTVSTTCTTNSQCPSGVCDYTGHCYATLGYSGLPPCNGDGWNYYCNTGSSSYGVGTCSPANTCFDLWQYQTTNPGSPLASQPAPASTTPFHYQPFMAYH
jgi:hypothetical protein